MLAFARTLSHGVPLRFARPVVRCASIALAMLSARSASAQCGSWSPEFGPRGVDGQVLAMKSWNDGSGPALYVAGDFARAGSLASRGIARWNGTSFVPIPSLTSGVIAALVVFDDGTGPALYAGGTFESIGGVPARNTARWNGIAWSEVGGGLVASVVAGVTCFVVHDDGTGPALYAGGYVPPPGTPGEGVARLNPGGWSLLGGGVTPTWSGGVFALASHDFGSGPKLYAAGNFEAAGGVAARGIASWDGTTWSPVAGGLGVAGSSVNALVLHPVGGVVNLFAAGTFLTAGGSAARRVARFDGTSWHPLGSGLLNGSGGYSLTEHVTGGTSELVVGGDFDTAGGVSANGIARWNGSWSAAGGGLGSTAGIQRVQSLETFDAGSGPVLHAGGSFHSADSTPVDGLARWNGTSWSGLVASQGITGTVSAIARDGVGSSATLIVGGYFDSAGGTPASSIARWNGSSWSALGTGIVGGPLASGVNAIASASTAGTTSIYAAGGFLTAGSVDVQHIAHFDGTAWTNMGSGTDLPVEALAIADLGGGPELYLGGTFHQAGGVTARGIARWDGASYHAVANGIDGRVSDLLVFDDGSGTALYATGAFANAGGIGASNIARWNGTSWSPLGAGLNGEGRDLVAYDDGGGIGLYACGAFTQAGGVPAVRLARWRNGSWTGLSFPEFGGSYRLAVYDDGSGESLYAAGAFGTPEDHAGLARWDGSQWHRAGGPLMVPTAIAAHDDGNGPSLFVGGSTLGYYAYGPSGAFARWTGCYTAQSIVCAGDGGGTPCPCANHSPVGAGAGCASSLGTGGRLRSSGYPRVAHDTLVLDADGMPNGTALYFQGTSTQGSGTAFGDGLLCAGGTVRRMGVVQNAGGASSYPQAGGASVSVVGAIGAAGGSYTYQVWYRDAAAFCTASSFNTTNGVAVTWIP